MLTENDFNAILAYAGTDGVQAAQTIQKTAKDLHYEISYDPNTRRFTLIGTGEHKGEDLSSIFKEQIFNSWTPKVIESDDCLQIALIPPQVPVSMKQVLGFQKYRLV